MSQSIILGRIPEGYFQVLEKEASSTTQYKIAIFVGALFVIAGAGFGASSLLKVLPSTLHMSSTVAGVVIGVGVFIGGSIIGYGAFKIHQAKKPQVQFINDKERDIRNTYPTFVQVMEDCLKGAALDNPAEYGLVKNKRYVKQNVKMEDEAKNIYSIAYRNENGEAFITRVLDQDEAAQLTRYLNAKGFVSIYEDKAKQLMGLIGRRVQTNV